MKQYIGTKLIEAEPAFRCTDNQMRVDIIIDPMGKEICMGKIRDRVWQLLGFLLQTAVNGVK